MSDDEFGDIPAHHQRAKARLSSSAYRHKYERADFFLPNAFQQRVLDALKNYKIICGRAAGQIGKSSIAAFVVTQLTTGRWKLATRREPKLDRAYRFVCWVLSESGATTILGMQTRLMGAMNDIGTGMMPLRAIKKITGAHGVPGCIGDVEIQMENGDLAIIRFKQFAQGVPGLTSESVDLVILDELPTGSDAERIWAELLQRTAATDGTIIIVATPGKQLSPVLIWCRENDQKNGVRLVTGTVEDAEHIEPERKAELAKMYMSISPATYRSKFLGEEFVGGGSALTFSLEDIVHERDVRSFGSATTWCIGLDLGHGSLAEKASKTAAVLLAHDPQTKMTWVCWEYEARALPESIVARIVEMPHGRAPCCWGAAEKSTTGTGIESFAEMFQRLGLNMGRDHVTHRDGSVYLDTSINEIQSQLSSGRLKIHRRCASLISQLRNLQRDEDNKLVNPGRGDDLFSALRYALMGIATNRARAGDDADGSSVFGNLYRQRRTKSWGDDSDRLNFFE